MPRFAGLMVALIAVAAVVPVHAGGGVQTFVEDFEGFVEAAGPGLLEIDFETLPDGTPSKGGTPITKDFNYTEQGVFFWPPVPEMKIVGNEVSGFSLSANSELGIETTWITADLVVPAYAVGTFFGGDTTLSAFDEDGDLIVTESFFGGGSGHFIGIVSDTPIAFSLNESFTNLEAIESYLFVPVPEPGSLVLLALPLGALCRRKRLRKEAPYTPIGGHTMRRGMYVFVGFVGMAAGLPVQAGGGVQTFVEDFEGFVEAAGPGLLEIDFETLPDGSPSAPGTPITKDFNYTEQGVFFWPPVPEMRIVGDGLGGFLLAADSENGIDFTWITADLIVPAYAVGTFFPGGTTLSAFDQDGNLIVTESFFAGGSGHFIGIVSDTPIAFSMNESFTSAEFIESYLFVPVPEPGSLVLLALASGALCCRRRLR